MIDVELEKAIVQLNQRGMGIRVMSRELSVSRNTVKAILKRLHQSPKVKRSKILIEPDILADLYKRCDGWGPRIRELLVEEHQIRIGYSTLMRLLNQHGYRKSSKARCGFEETRPGLEMQHDTSPCRITVGGTKTRAEASLLYFRYSKQRHLKFYPRFRRFEMKCFFYKALTYFRYVAPVCVVDNTNLARLRGTGQNAVFAPEMVTLAKEFGFSWLAHEKGHCNRKAGEERSFWTVETNFLSGREFKSWEDLNSQAFQWATQTMANRPQTKARIVPNIFFEQEKPLLTPIKDFIREPSLFHDRSVDQYGYVALEGNFYWVPGNDRGETRLHQYKDRVAIYRGRQKVAEYTLPPVGTKNERIPDRPPRRSNADRVSKMSTIEKVLRATSAEMSQHLDFVLKPDLSIGAKQKILEHLGRLSRTLPQNLLNEALLRAQRYGVTDVNAIERISMQLFRNSLMDVPLPEIADEFRGREVYQEGRFSAHADLSSYQQMLKSHEAKEEE